MRTLPVTVLALASLVACETAPSVATPETPGASVAASPTAVPLPSATLPFPTLQPYASPEPFVPKTTPGPYSGPSSDAGIPGCRLPFDLGDAGAGFLQLPSGAFTPDAAAAVSIDWPVGTAGPPRFGRFYDVAKPGWLPVPRDWVSPDGIAFAYPDPSAGIHVDPARGGAGKVIGTDSAWMVLDYESEGIYATHRAPAGTPPSGLWLLDSSGSERSLFSDGHFYWVSRGSAWGIGRYPSFGTEVNNIERRPLTGGETRAWVSFSDNQWVLGFEGSDAVTVQRSGSASGIANVTLTRDSNLGETFTVQADPANFGPLSEQLDTAGLWFTLDALYLGLEARGPKRAANIRGSIAGRCL